MALAPGAEWASGNPIELRNRIAQAMDNGPKDLTLLFDRAYVGQAAVKLADGIATKAEICTVMAELIVRCENDVRDKTKAMLAIGDTTSQKYVQLHYEARVAAGVISYVNQLVSEGIQAGQLINDEGASDV